MSPTLTFVPPPWVTALLLRPPPPPPTTHPRAPPSAMRDLVAQWLVHATDDVPTTNLRPHVFARFRDWLAFVFRLPILIRQDAMVKQPLPDAQHTLIERSLFFASELQDEGTGEDAALPTTPVSEQDGGIEEGSLNMRFRLSPLYKSLYFSAAEGEQSVPPRCDTREIVQDEGDKRCVQSFFLMDATGEGKGILEGLREMKAQTNESQRKRGWVPAVVSLILIALNPLK